MWGLLPSAWLALSLMCSCLLALEEGLGHMGWGRQCLQRGSLALSAMGVGEWAVAAPHLLSECSVPWCSGTLVGWGDCARKREPFMTSREGVNRARAWPGQGLHFSSPVAERLKLSVYSCYFLLQLCLRPSECSYGLDMPTETRMWILEKLCLDKSQWTATKKQARRRITAKWQNMFSWGS